MSKIIEKTNLDDEPQDKAITLMGHIPEIGSALQAIFGHFIPNQRQERVNRFLSQLQLAFAESAIESWRQMPEKVSLIEEALVAYGMCPHEKRRERIAKLSTFGLSQSELDADHHSRLLQLLLLLSDTDIIVLQLFAIHKANLPHEQRLKELTSFAQKNSGLLLIKNQFDQNEKAEKEGKVLSHASYLNSLALLQPLKLQNYVRNIDGRNAHDENRFAHDIARAINEAIHVAAEKRFEISRLGLELLKAIDAQPISTNAEAAA